MLPILAITNDKRVLQTMRACRLRFKGRFETSSDFDHGLKAIFEWRPGLIFIQHELAGVSASVVARHVRGLLGTESPMLIILSSGPIPAEMMKDLFDGAVNLKLPDQELTETLMLHIEHALGENGEPPQLSESPEILPLRVEVASMPSGSEVMAQHPPQNEAMTEPPAPPAAQLSREQSAPPRSTVAKPALSLPPIMKAPVITPHMENGEGANRRTKSSRRLFVLEIIVALLLVAGACLWLIPTPWQRSAVNHTATAPALPPQLTSSGLSLPEPVRLAATDPAFSASQPGWERRTAKGVEYRLFREGNSLIAIQVMATEKAPLPETILRDILSGATGAASHLVASSAVRSGFLIQQGSDASGADMELYRNPKTGELRGFVLSRSTPRP